MANTELGIARFQIEDTEAKTSVIGLGATGQEVARLDLVHGQFALTGMFQQDYDTPEVDGRKLDVTIHGRPRLTWETAGYDPTLHMPAHPPSEADLAAFLADPHVAAVLDRWQIGFEPSEGPEGEVAYGGAGTTAGTDAYSCPSYRPAYLCGIARGLWINTCGGNNVVPYKAYRLTRTTPTYAYDEYFIDQYCPPTGSITTDWFGRKSCPTTGTGAQPSTCGTTGASGACKGCAGYPGNAEAAGDVVATSPGTRWCYQNSGDQLTCYGAYDGTECVGGLPLSAMCECSCTCNGGYWQCD